MIKAIIFDCFGVLVEDSLKAIGAGLEPELRQRVIDVLHAAHHGLIESAESTRRVCEILGITAEEYRRQVDAGEIKNRPLLAYIGELHQTYKTAILSNISIGGIGRRFTAEELSVFDAVVASGEVGYAKPEAQIYEIAADRLEVRLEECVFTDDREEYCEGARGVGMQAILFEDFEQFKHDLQKLLPAKPSV
jgi:HAD superfamily hydrolase (TIGR01509 family)